MTDRAMTPTPCPRCRALVLNVRLDKGTPVQLDAEPNAGGTHLLEPSADPRDAPIARKRGGYAGGGGRYFRHVCRTEVLR